MQLYGGKSFAFATSKRSAYVCAEVHKEMLLSVKQGGHFRVFGMTHPGFELTTIQSQGGHSITRPS